MARMSAPARRRFVVQFMAVAALASLAVAEYPLQEAAELSSPAASVPALPGNIAIISSLTPMPPLAPVSSLSSSPSRPLRLPSLHLTILNPAPFPTALARGILLTVCLHPTPSASPQLPFSTDTCLQWLHPLIPPPPPAPVRPFVPRPDHNLPSGTECIASAALSHASAQASFTTAFPF